MINLHSHDIILFVIIIILMKVHVMNIVIVGAGAVGLLFYQAFNRYKNAENLSLSLKSHNTITSSFTFTNIQGLSSLTPLVSTTKKHLIAADIILICVKSYQVNSALKDTVALLNKKATIILCHNGMGAFEEYLELQEDSSNDKNNLISQTVLSLLITHGSKKSTKQHIIHTGQGIGDLGYIYGDYNHELLQKITRLFNRVLPSISWHDNIKEKQWLKLAINTVINPLTAVHNIANGQILLPKYHHQINQLIDEFNTVANKHGIEFSNDFLLSKIYDVARKTARNRSSMLSDVINKRKTEIDYINGYIVKLGKEYNVTTITHQALIQQVKALN